MFANLKIAEKRLVPIGTLKSANLKISVCFSIGVHINISSRLLKSKTNYKMKSKLEGQKLIKLRKITTLE